jgi:hypothetical protein
MMLTFAFASFLATVPALLPSNCFPISLNASPGTGCLGDLDDEAMQELQAHAEAANRLALGEVLSPRISWPVPDWAFAEMPWISVSGLPRTPLGVASSVARNAVEDAMQAEADAAASIDAANAAWHTAVDWLKVGDAIKTQAKSSPFDAKMSPFDLEGDRD